jgi:hypothetical protein
LIVEDKRRAQQVDAAHVAAAQVRAVTEAAVDAVERTAALDDGGVGELALLGRKALTSPAAAASGWALGGGTGRWLARRRLRRRLRGEKDAGQQHTSGCSQDYMLSHGHLEMAYFPSGNRLQNLRMLTGLVMRGNPVAYIMARRIESNGPCRISTK